MAIGRIQGNACDDSREETVIGENGEREVRYVGH